MLRLRLCSGLEADWVGLIVAQNEVEERIARIAQHKGVKGLIIVKKTEMKEGNQPQIVKTTMPHGPETTAYAVRLSELAITARSLVRDLDPKNDLTFLRISCKVYDMMIAPDRDYFLIVVQNLGETEEQQHV